MMALSFSAQCARGHERIEFTDRAAFEAHMIGEHKAKILRPGGTGRAGDRQMPHRRPAPGWSRGKIEKPYAWAAPKPTPGGLERVTERIAADEYRWPGFTHYFPVGPRVGLGNPAAEVA